MDLPQPLETNETTMIRVVKDKCTDDGDCSFKSQVRAMTLGYLTMVVAAATYLIYVRCKCEL